MKAKFCVAQVYLYGDKADVSFYAYRPDAYGLHTVGDINDKNIVWYDTEKEALTARVNSNDCVISNFF